MAASFDAYHEWLGISPKDQPPHHYRLLGIDRYEAKANVIDSAADRQMAHLRTFQTGQRAEQCQQLLNEVSAARVLLLDRDKKAAYDAQLKKKLNAEREAAQPRVVRAIPLNQPAAPATAVQQPVGAVPLGAASSAPRIHGGSSRHRKQRAPWMALGVGATVLGIVGVIAVMAMTNDNEEPAEAGPSAGLSKSAGVDPGSKSVATTAPTSPDTDPAKSETDEPTKETSNTTPEVDPSSDDDKKESPPDDPSDDNKIPFKEFKRDDLPPDDPLLNEFAPPDKAAVPDGAALATVEAEIRDVFDVHAVRDVKAKAKLAREILDKALESDDDPVAQFAMLRMVRDMSAKHGDYAAAERTIVEMDERFEVDAVALRSQAMIEALASKTPPDWRKQLSRSALRVVADFHKADRSEQASKVMSVVLRSASRLRDQELLADARKLRSDGVVLAKQYEAVRPAFETLKTKPDDPAANTAAGKHLCYVKGDWDRGLAMLVKGDDALLMDLAVREQRGVTSFSEQLAVANAWWKIAEEQRSRTSGEVRGHAAHWYRMALPNLSALDKVKAQNRLDRVAALGAQKAAKRPLHPADAVALGGHWYKVVVGRITWDEAKRRCEQMGGYLACLETETEAKAIGSLVVRSGKISEKRYVCLGGFKDRQGRWQWINGRRMSFTYFNAREPNNQGGSEDRLTADRFGYWNDSSGGHPTIQGFVCEWDR